MYRSDDGNDRDVIINIINQWMNPLYFLMQYGLKRYDCEKFERRSDIMEFEEIKVEKVEYKESEIVKFECIVTGKQIGRAHV